MAQLGRIGGHLLNQNLNRNGVDLKFSNTSFDSESLLYIDVNNGRIGVKTDTPVYDLDVDNDIRTTDLIADSTAKIDNLLPKSNSVFTTTVGPIIIKPGDGTGSYMEFQRMRSDDLDFNDNTISGLNSNQSVELKPSGTGKTDISASTDIFGNLYVTGNITVDGNLTNAENIILGDELYNPDTGGGGSGDTIEIVPDFTQSIIPGDDNTYELGKGTLIDSSKRRWKQVFITDNLTNTDNVSPASVLVSSQIRFDGIANTIFADQSNDDVILAPDSGNNIIESTKWHEITASSSAASISGYSLTVGGTITGSFIPGTQLSGIGIIPGTIITEQTTGSDSTGTYLVNINYDGSGSNPSPTGTIAITGSVDSITNLSDIGGQVRLTEPFKFRSTGQGYLRFMGSNGFIMPAGDNSTRPARPELGDTRWNTDENYLEAFAGLIEVVTAVANLSGIANQFVDNVSGVTDGNGENATFDITVSGGSLGIAISAQGQGYSTNDIITIPGTVLSGGATPTNDIIVTVGAQTDDGYNIATGGGAEVDVELMEDLSDVYSLMLG